MISVKKIDAFKDYGSCVEISNGVISAVVTVDIGPRIISFGYVGGQNFMASERKAFEPMTDKEFTDFFGEGRCWENLGGHRIWLSPEKYPDTYTPDDKSVEYTVTENGAVFKPVADTEIGVQKEMELLMDPDDANMQVKMRVTNISGKPKKFAIWALSVCDKGGTLIVPMNTVDTGLLHNRSISVWPYTDMSNDRIYWGSKYVTLRQDDSYSKPIKLGFDLNCGTAYYVKDGEILCKNYETHHPDGIYPDAGCSFETYTNEVMLEFETLGELKTVADGETSEHIEHWSLCKQPCEVDFKNDASIENLLSEI